MSQKFLEPAYIEKNRPCLGASENLIEIILYQN